jgi:hypothetical protein
MAHKFKCPSRSPISAPSQNATDGSWSAFEDAGSGAKGREQRPGLDAL